METSEKRSFSDVFNGYRKREKKLGQGSPMHFDYLKNVVYASRHSKKHFLRRSKVT